MSLRIYQDKALQNSKLKFDSGVNRQLIKLPTGMGKTVVFCSVPEYFGFNKRLMILVHREELASQAAEKAAIWNTGKTVGIEMADSEAGNSDIVVASVATIGKKSSSRLQLFNPKDFDALVIDEAHHATAKSYLNVISHFDVHNDISRLLLGVTATPNRSDGEGLNKVFQEIVYDYSLLDGIEDGWLAPLRGIRISSQTDLDIVSSLAGDFNQGELDTAINQETRNRLIADSWLEHAAGKQTIAFTSSVNHAIGLANAFKGKGVKAEAIWGEDNARESKLAKHRNREIQVICNVGILTEGYDDWRIECIIDAAPTKSETKYVQMIGRGTRIQEGIGNMKEAIANNVVLQKKDCLILDIVDNTTKHSLVTLPTLFGLHPKFNFEGKQVITVLDKIKKIQEAKQVQEVKADNLQDFQVQTEEVDLFKVTFSPEVVQYSEFQWKKISQDHYKIFIPNCGECVIKGNLLGSYDIDGRVYLQTLKSSKPKFKDAINYADDLMRKFAGPQNLSLLRREAKWHGDPPTEKQLKLAKAMGIQVPALASKGDVAKKLADHFNKVKKKYKPAVPKPDTNWSEKVDPNGVPW